MRVSKLDDLPLLEKGRELFLGNGQWSLRKFSSEK